MSLRTRTPRDRELLRCETENSHAHAHRVRELANLSSGSWESLRTRVRRIWKKSALEENELAKTYLRAGRWEHHLPSLIPSSLIGVVVRHCRVVSSVVVVRLSLVDLSWCHSLSRSLLAKQNLGCSLANIRNGRRSRNALSLDLLNGAVGWGFDGHDGGVTRTGSGTGPGCLFWTWAKPVPVSAGLGIPAGSKVCCCEGDYSLSILFSNLY